MSTFSYVIAALFIVEGIFSLVTGNTIGGMRNPEQIAAKYDMRSYSKFNRLVGASTLVMGIIFLIGALGSSEVIPFDIPKWIEIVVFGLVVVAIVLGGIFLLKKKGNGNEKKSSDDKFIDED